MQGRTFSSKGACEMSLTLSPEGVEVAYRVIGTGPPDLLFLHGWAGSTAYFEESYEALDLERARAIGVDLSGHGESPASEAAWSLDGIDNAVLAAADAAGAERFVAVGYSMGAKFALHVAITHPERVAALVLVSRKPAGANPMPHAILADSSARPAAAGALQGLVLPVP